MDALSPFMPLLATIVGTLLSVLCGVIISMLMGVKEEMKDIEHRVNIRIESVETKMYNHITYPDIHSDAIKRMDEQIKSLYQIVKIAHERVDRLENKQ